MLNEPKSCIVCPTLHTIKTITPLQIYNYVPNQYHFIPDIHRYVVFTTWFLDSEVAISKMFKAVNVIIYSCKT